MAREIFDRKKYHKKLNHFIIKFLKLNKNFYTQNDFLFVRSYVDFKISYNPRCQLLDFTPALKGNSLIDGYYEHEYNKMLQIVRSIYEKMAFEFFTEYGEVMDKYLYARLYGVSANRMSMGSVPYTTVISKNNLEEWGEVENWVLHSENYRNDPVFKYAYWGDRFGRISTPNKKEQKIIRSNYKKPRAILNPTKELYSERY